ncbi:MAG: phytanoyl-CoA dioxygenase family protein [Alphaproteobacteria bacterium]|nr:phytanoyl-CoA dioxygenase family protein [Alphaproteobacteria bacterium]
MTAFNGADFKGVELAEKVEKDGYFIIEDYFPLDDVMSVRKELEAIMDADVAHREENKLGVRRFTEEGNTYSTLTPVIHSIMHSLWQSPGLRTFFERVFTDPEIKEFTRRVIGERFRIRADIVRRATGANDYIDDFQIPHQWHRDSTGEFAFGIFFDDFSPDLSGGTGVMKGTHWRGYSPQFDFVFSDNCLAGQKYVHDKRKRIKFLNPVVEKMCVINSRFKDQFRDSRVELKGRPGGLYFFLNETWHGRMPNIHGGKNMLVRWGGFASEFAFKDDRPLPGPTSILPPVVAQHYQPDQAPNTDPTTLLQRMRAAQEEDRNKMNMAKAAYWEKQTARFISHTIRMVA